MKKVFLSLVCMALFYGASAQFKDEFRYFVFRLGASHNVLSPQPETSPNKFLRTPVGDMLLFPSQARTGKMFLDYNISLTGDFQFHYDFESNKFGIVVGAQGFSCATAAKYISETGENWLTEKYRIFAVGVPVFFKLSDEMFENQKYFFFGGQYNFNLYAQQIQITDWSDLKRTHWISQASGEMKKNNYVVFAGFNYQIFNVEINYMPETFLNTEYVIQDTKFTPHATQRNNIFFVKTSLTIPLSKWITRRSFFLYKLFR